MSASSCSVVDATSVPVGGGTDSSSTAMGNRSKTIGIDSIVSGLDRQGVGGILINDPTGLCLASRGVFDAVSTAGSGVSDQAGIFTSLTRLAAQLQHADSGSDDRDLMTAAGDGAKHGAAAAAATAPLITLESGSVAIIIKDYDGHVVAIRVPTKENHL